MEYVDIINRISELRIRENLSARKLSWLLEKNDSYINGLETRKNFLPSMEVVLEIIKVCNSTPTEFFYYSLPAYKNDKDIIDLLKTATTERKETALSVLKMK